MDAIEAGELLGTCAAFDRRDVDPVDVVAWARALWDLPFADCEQAVIDHYADSTDWIKPAHVRRRVKAFRAARLATVRQPAPAADPDDPIGYREAFRAGIATIAAGAPERRAIGGAR